MKSRTLIVSVAIHVGLACAMLFAAERKQARRSIAVAVVDEKKPEKKKEEKPKPAKPIVAPPPRAAPKAEPAKQAAPAPTAPVQQAAAPGPAPVETGLTLGDADGPGIDIGGPAKPVAPVKKAEGPETAEKGPKKAPVGPKKAAEKTEEECLEEPTRPEVITKTEIEYTSSARAAGVEGRLVIRVTIAADGTVAKAEVVNSVDAALDAAAIAAVERWRFKPSLKCGKPTFGGIYTLARRFELGD